MKILHTSDWHLGRSLYGEKRYTEFAKFLTWLAQTIAQQEVEALLVAGDIFDTSMPSNLAQELYYRFLCRVAASCCRHVVVIAGNHDSPSFLEAPKELLRALNVYVVGQPGSAEEAEMAGAAGDLAKKYLADEVIVLHKNEVPEAIICAVPYLRDRYIRTVEAGETIDVKNAKLISGLKKHYAYVCDLAEQKQTACKNAGYDGIPIIAMGHLFTAGGQTIDGDGVRELYVGSLAHVGEEIFPSSIAYLALGHLHVPQAVGKSEHIRYSGSPIPMGYGEAAQQKKVLLLEFAGGKPNIRELAVPCFQQLLRLVGSVDDIRAQLEKLQKEKSTAWLEIEHTGCDVAGNLHEMLGEALVGLKVLRLKNRSVTNFTISAVAENETLDDLTPSDVFVRCLDSWEISVPERAELTVSYNEIIASLLEEDGNAE